MDVKNIQNPLLIGGAIHCTVEVRLGDGVGAEWERVPYVAVPDDVAGVGNLVWGAIRAGEYQCTDGHVANFNPTLLPADGSEDPAAALEAALLWPVVQTVEIEPDPEPEPEPEPETP